MATDTHEAEAVVALLEAVEASEEVHAVAGSVAASEVASVEVATAAVKDPKEDFAEDLEVHMTIQRIFHFFRVFVSVSN